jgi:hypothetical protein
MSLDAAGELAEHGRRGARAAGALISAAFL